MLNLFYAEPDFDRWLPLDRFPRRLIRRIVRGAPRPGGQMRVFLNLCAGLDRLGVPYRKNDYSWARRHPGEICCILGKRHLLDGFPFSNPLIVGPCCHNHPLDAPDLATRKQVRRILVPGEWMRKMCEPAWGTRVQAWPVGIDTDLWQPAGDANKTVDFLFYNKIRWDHPRREETLLTPLRAALRNRGLTFSEISYGHYQPAEYRELLGRCRAMIFLCEHETQGLAYQEALSSGLPLFAWDHGGEWLDPEFYPERVRFGPVSSVPYFDERCGLRFADATEFTERLPVFLEKLKRGEFSPRAFILENLTLEKCAQQFCDIVASAT